MLLLALSSYYCKVGKIKLPPYLKLPKYGFSLMVPPYVAGIH